MSFKSLFVKYHLLNWTRTKMKNRNHPWSLQNQKSTFTVKFSPCSSFEVTFLFLFVSRTELQPAFILVHPGLASIFIFRLSPQPLRPTTEISRFLWLSVVANFKICHGRSRNSSVVEFQSDFVSERPFFQFHEQQAKFAYEVHRLSHFFEKGGS